MLSILTFHVWQRSKLPNIIALARKAAKTTQEPKPLPEAEHAEDQLGSKEEVIDSASAPAAAAEIIDISDGSGEEKEDDEGDYEDAGSAEDVEISDDGDEDGEEDGDDDGHLGDIGDEPDLDLGVGLFSFSIVLSAHVWSKQVVLFYYSSNLLISYTHNF